MCLQGLHMLHGQTINNNAKMGPEWIRARNDKLTSRKVRYLDGLLDNEKASSSLSRSTFGWLNYTLPWRKGRSLDLLLDTHLV